jgi:curved DNA-binding protein CbpA
LERTYYEILGVPQTASTEVIKKRYRQLVLKYHPDVAKDKLGAKAAFLEASEAYKTLVNKNKRDIYDATLITQGFRANTSEATSRRGRPQAEQQRQRPSSVNTTAEVLRILAEAQTAYIEHRYALATDKCLQAQRLDPHSAKAHDLLGDVYKAQGRNQEAIAMYTIAAQLDPRSSLIRAKLNRLIDKTPYVVDQRDSMLRTGANIILAAIGIFLFGLLAIDPRRFPPVIGSWNWMLIMVLLTDGVVIGFILSMSDKVRLMDEEWTFMSGSGAAFPVGILLGFLSIVFFYVAAAGYVVVSLFEGSFSASVIKAFLATFALVCLTAIIYIPDRQSVMLFGGNVAFPGVLFGWMVGDVIRPRPW